MSNLIEIKNLFDKELKKFKKIIKTVTDKYKEISEEHELLLADVEALDTRLIFVEKKLKISNDFDIYNNSTNNIKDLSEFRYQIITRTKARQMKNNIYKFIYYCKYILNIPYIFFLINWFNYIYNKKRIFIIKFLEGWLRIEGIIGGFLDMFILF